MATQLSGTTAVLVSETNATSYYQGGPFTLGGGPFTDLSFSADDDETEFASFGAQYGESSGAGRQTGELTDGSGGTVDQGLTSLEDVLVITDPNTGDQITVGRVSIRVDNGAPGGGAQTQDFYIFSAPIDPSVTYTISSIEYTPGSSTQYQYSTFDGGSVVCFAAGTLILTETGPRPVEAIRPGERVQTVDNGLQPVVWAGARRLGRAVLAANWKLRPVRIAPGALGNDQPLFVSQQHRILYGDHFIKARHLTEIPGLAARIAHGKRRMSYHHLLLEDHQVLLADGIGAESLFTGPVARGILCAGAMGPVQDFGILHDKGPHGGLSRPMLKRHQVARLPRHAA